MTFGVLALIVLAGMAGPLLAFGRQALLPVVVGELLAGVVIGISGFRWLDPAERQAGRSDGRPHPHSGRRRLGCGGTREAGSGV